MVIHEGDLLRAVRGGTLHYPYKPHTEKIADRLRASRFFRKAMLRHGPYYTYSLLYLVVEAPDEWNIWVKRLDKHAQYMVSPYTVVGERYLKRWCHKVGERRDIAEEARRRKGQANHYAGLLH